MTRADELLAEVRGLLDDPDQQGKALWFAVRELDAFMSAFGVLPKDWTVKISGAAARPLDVHTRTAAATKLGLVLREELERQGFGSGPVSQALAGVLAGVVVEAIQEERRQAEALQRYAEIYSPVEVAREAAPPHGLVIDGDGFVRAATPEELSASIRRDPRMPVIEPGEPVIATLKRWLREGNGETFGGPGDGAQGG